MNNTTNAVRSAPQIWLSVLLMAVAAGALAVLLLGILHVQAGPSYVPPAFRQTLAFRAVICWVVSTTCAYAGGFIVGRRHPARV